MIPELLQLAAWIVVPTLTLVGFAWLFEKYETWKAGE